MPVISHHVPPQYAHKGYTVLNDDGRVLRVVPRQLTPEEIRVRDAELERVAAREKAREAAVKRDEELMQLYATPDEVTDAMNRKIKNIEGEIQKLKTESQQLRQ